MFDHDRLINKVGDGRGEYGISAGDFPMLLQDDREGQPVLLYLHPVFLCLTFADHYHFELRMLAMEFLEFRRQRVTRAAARAGEHQEDVSAAQVRERKISAS